MEITFSKEGKRTPILDSSEKSIDLDKRLRNISKLLVLGAFLEPVLDFLGLQFSIASLTVYSFQ